ncbi:MAG: ComF family protein [candidate division Zixibacteria bacterium]|nr:ComF family protein [candidate division Zixibacteria bacterium]
MMLNTESSDNIKYDGFKKLLGDFKEDLACFLFPPFCYICNNPLKDGRSAICNDCRKNVFLTIRSSSPLCPVCQSFYPDIFDNCRHCSGRRSPGKLYCLTGFDSNMRELIHAFKYAGRIEIGAELADKAYDIYGNFEFILNADLIIPVPLYYRKELDRGYNQAGILAERLSLKTSKPFDKTNLKRVKNTKSQTHLNTQQRYTNVRGAFKVKNPSAVKGKRIVLVDDVVTTGATLYECSRSLKKAGASKVVSLTIARPVIQGE